MYKPCLHAFVVGAAPLCLATAPALAQPDTDTVTDNLSMEAGLVGTFQDSDDSDVGSETLSSLDLVFNLELGPGNLVVYAEGSTSPQPGDVAGVFGEVNGDAGSALDSNGDGRLQVSEFRYTLNLERGGHVTAGLLDTTVYLDTTSHANPTSGPDFSGIANDETSQFLGNSFVNNPIVEFPDYALGIAYGTHDIDERFGLQATLTSSNGLADNDDASYSELVDVGADGKGVFAAVEGHYHAGPSFLARLGLWTNTRDHQRLDTASDDADNRGVYGVFEGGLGPGHYNVRLGYSDPDVSPGETFVALATEQPLGFATLGLGLAHTGASDELGPGSDDTIHAETFLRFDVNDYLQISPDLQYVENSGFDADRDGFVYGLRVAGFFSAS